MPAPGAYRRTEVMTMANTKFVVQAYHYAQYTANEAEDGSYHVEIHDEDDVNLALVAVCDDLPEAEAAAEKWEEANEPDTDAEGIEGQPLASINIWEVPVGTFPAQGRFVKTVEI